MVADRAPVTARRRPWPPPPVSRLRVLTGRLRALPDIMIIGEMRSGSSSLYRYLRDHPQIVPPWTKELHYFDRLYGNGLDWYRAHFPTRAAMRIHGLRHGKALTFEATPSYLVYPAVARRIASTIPQVKLIALLRNPADRAYSHYQLNLRVREEHHSFEKAIKREGKRLEGELEQLEGDEPLPSRRLRRYSYVLRGIYVDSLQRYERYFPREQMLVLKSEDLFERTQEIYDQVLSFVGLDPWRLRSTEAAATGGYSREKPRGYDELRDFFASHNQRLYEYLGRDMGW